MRFLFNKIKNWFIELKMFNDMIALMQEEIERTM
jgi:hypothetical protein